MTKDELTAIELYFERDTTVADCLVEMDKASCGYCRYHGVCEEKSNLEAARDEVFKIIGMNTQRLKDEAKKD